MSEFKYNSSIWISETPERIIQVLDQRFLPFETKIFRLASHQDVYYAIREMVVRGAPLIGVTAAYGMYLALLNYRGNSPFDYLKNTAGWLNSARPTAVNLSFSTGKMLNAFQPGKPAEENIDLLFREAENNRLNDVESCYKIGEHGLSLIKAVSEKKGNEPVQILTHCNAGWLACVEWGTALAPVYMAHRAGIRVHVWVDETRPRNQGARLTAFELDQAGVPYTVIADNTGGHLMQHGMIDMVIVGSDRTAVNGDTANKIGTYLKALAAFDNRIPFYIALPLSSIDCAIEDGLTGIPIEERGADELAVVEGISGNGICSVRIIPENSPVVNYGFDVTPARLITGLITEKGFCRAEKNSILNLYFEKKPDA